MIPTFRLIISDYNFKRTKRIFRAHIVNALQKSLLPSLVNDKFVQGDNVDPGMLMAEPGGDVEVDIPPEPELDAEVDDEVDAELEDELLRFRN